LWAAKLYFNSFSQFFTDLWQVLLNIISCLLFLENILDLIFDLCLSYNLALYGVDWVSHVVRHCRINQIKKLFLAHDFIVENFAGAIDYLNHLVLCIVIFQQLLSFDLDVFISQFLLEFLPRWRIFLLVLKGDGHFKDLAF